MLEAFSLCHSLSLSLSYTFVSHPRIGAWDRFMKHAVPEGAVSSQAIVAGSTSNERFGGVAMRSTFNEIQL